MHLTQLNYDIYEERKKLSAFSWREFAKLAGFVSPTYLRLVCTEKTNLSKPGVQKVSTAMGLEGFERTYFEHMVCFSHAKSDKDRKKALNEIQQAAKLNKIQVLNADGFRFCESPIYLIVRELAPLMPNALPSDIAAKITHKVAAQEVRDALQFLVKSDLLKKTSENVYAQTSKMVKISKEALPLTVRSMNREMGRLGVESLDTENANERSVSGVTMGIDLEAFLRIEQEINECRRKVIAIANSSKKNRSSLSFKLTTVPTHPKSGLNLTSEGMMKVQHLLFSTATCLLCCIACSENSQDSGVWEDEPAMAFESS